MALPSLGEPGPPAGGAFDVSGPPLPQLFQGFLDEDPMCFLCSAASLGAPVGTTLSSCSFVAGCSEHPHLGDKWV